MNKSTEVDQYIAGFPEEVQDLLRQLRAFIQNAVPEAQESISYAIPTFKLEGNLVHYAAFKNHIGFYPGPSALLAFQEELAGYKGAKGSVQFPLHQPLPWDAIAGIVALRVKQNLAKAAAKAQVKKKTTKN